MQKGRTQAGDPEIDARAAFCRDIAESAGAVALAGFRNRSADDITMKSAQDFLTESDAAVEEHLKARIAQAFPDDDFFGEETGGVGSSRSVWVVDPIDGTANFARGIAHFCISIAYVRNGVTEIGSIYAPASDEHWFARRGSGADCSGKKMSVSGTKDFGAACLELGWSRRLPLVSYTDILTRLLETGANVRRGASGALGLAYVADGRSDGYAELHMNSWDSLAGLLLVEEAGGRICPPPSNRIATGGPVLAVAPGLAEAVSEATGIALEPCMQEEPLRATI